MRSFLPEKISFRENHHCMRKEDIKRYLKDYSIYGSRKTTNNHAFASSISVSETYYNDKISQAYIHSGQDP